VIDVNNPDQKLKPGMTANLTITIDERNNVLKVPNSALRFTPTDASGQTTGRSGNGAGNAGGQAGQASQSRQGRQSTDNAGASSSPGQQPGAQQNGERQFAPATAPVLDGQTRRIWVMGQDGKLQSRRIKVGLTDGVSTEVVEGGLQEGELVVIGQTLTSASKAQSSQTPAPGFGGAPRTGAPGGGRRN
jgi:HlyD family secretion protein